MFLKDVEFATMYREHFAAVGRGRTPVSKWEAKAAAMTLDSVAETSMDPYLVQLLALMALEPSDTVLDVGCGSGSLAVAMAAQAKAVYALDYSPTMLAHVQARAAQQSINTIHTIEKDWYEPWDEVPMCEVAVASRSSLVEDMAAAVIKLSQKARRRVWLTYPTDRQFGAPKGEGGAAHPLGMPEYFYVPAILHQLGVQATVQFIEAAHRWAVISWCPQPLWHPRSEALG